MIVKLAVSFFCSLIITYLVGRVLVPALRSVVARVDLEAGEMLLDGARLDEVAVFDED